MKKGQHQRPHVRRLKKTGTTFTAGQQQRTATKYDRYVHQLSAMINRPQYVYQISLSLRTALREIRRAIMDGNIALAADLTSVKSYISGGGPSDVNLFWEEGERADQRRIYSYLDSLHAEMSFDAGKMPHSMMAMHSDGTVSSAPPVQPKSPTLKRILHEQARIDKISRERMEVSPLTGNEKDYWNSGTLLEGERSGNSIWMDRSGHIVVQYDNGYKSQYPVKTANGQLAWDKLDVPKELRKKAAQLMGGYDRW
jgi:hypothetical protein